jgi:hypothetical protein
MESRTPQQEPTLVCRPKRTGPLTALVLGGGGSRGAVGVGLYRAIVELGIPIDLIVSSSIGAVNGALIAAGMAPTKLKDVKPDRATIIVQIMLRGEAPPDSTARVDIGSYSADPTGNMVSYGEQSQTVPLKEKNIVVKFTAEANSQTLQGKIIVAATIHKTTKGVNIKQPESCKRLARRIGNDGSPSLLAVGPLDVEALRRSLHSQRTGRGPSSLSSRSKGDPGLARDIAHEIGSKPVYLTVRNCTSQGKR